MTYVRLSPDGSAGTGSLAGAASVHAALSDASDSSYVSYSQGQGSLLTFEALSLPSGAVLLSAQVVARVMATLPVPYSARMDTDLNVGGTTATRKTVVSNTVPAEVEGAIRAYDVPFTDADVDAAGAGIGNGSQFASLIVYEASLRVFYFEQPTVTVDSPSGTISTNVITVDWTPTIDPDATPPYVYEVRVFSAAQYGAGGFDPETSDATLEYSQTYGSSQTAVWFANQPLPDGDYRAYVRVATSGSPGLTSDWEYSAFTVDAPNPGIPTLTATADSDNGRIELVVDDTSGDATTDSLQLQRSEDEGATWVDVRTAAGDGAVSGTGATVYDYEAPNGLEVTYRARAYNESNRSYSDWVTDTAEWSSASWWLKHNSKPSLNFELGFVRSVPGYETPSNQGVFRALGSSKAVVVSDTPGPTTGQIVVMLDDQAEADALAATLALQVPMLLQAPVSADVPERWVVFGDRAFNAVVDKSWVHEHDVTLPWTEVDRPTGALEE